MYIRKIILKRITEPINEKIREKEEELGRIQVKQIMEYLHTKKILEEMTKKVNVIYINFIDSEKGRKAMWKVSSAKIEHMKINIWDKSTVKKEVR